MDISRIEVEREWNSIIAASKKSREVTYHKKNQTPEKLL